jgi:hypothetical protein
MLRLLAAFTVLALGVGALVMSWQPASAYNVTFALYHPDGPSTDTNYLTCGWHNNCTYGPDGGAALDWQPTGCTWTPNGSDCHQKQVWVRLWGIGGGTSPTWVGRAESYYDTYPCKEIETSLMRISDWAVFGYVHAYHSGGNPNHNYWNLFASTAGRQNAAVGGYMLPHAQDNCSSTGDHTHQFYESGPNDSWWAKNSAISSTCDECGTPYPVWNTHEYAIQWNS